MIKLDKNLLLTIRKKLESDKKMTLLIIPVCLILLYLDFTFVMKPQLSGIKTLTPKIIKLKKDLSGIEKDLLRMQDLKNKQIEGKLKQFSGAPKIISEEYIALLLQEVSDLANKNAVRIVQMKPEKAAQSQKQEKVSPPAKITPLLINLELLCDYHHLGGFLNDLENAQSFIAVQNIKITSQAADFFRQKVNLVLRTYVKK